MIYITRVLTILKKELEQTGTTRFFVRAQASARHTELAEILEDDSVKIRIAAPPEGGKANAALIKFLAKEFGVPKTNVEIVSGATARIKLIRITN